MVRTFNDLVQVEDEQDDEDDILDVVAAGEPVPDGRDESDDDGQVQVGP